MPSDWPCSTARPFAGAFSRPCSHKAQCAVRRQPRPSPWRCQVPAAGACTALPLATCSSTPRAQVAGSSGRSIWVCDRRYCPCRLQAGAGCRVSRRWSKPGCSQLPASQCLLSTPRSMRVTGCPASSGSRGVQPFRSGVAGCTPAACRMAACMSAKGTAVAVSKISHSWATLSRVYWLPGSTASCCALLSTNTAARFSTRGHRHAARRRSAG